MTRWFLGEYPIPEERQKEIKKLLRARAAELRRLMKQFLKR